MSTEPLSVRAAAQPPAAARVARLRAAAVHAVASLALAALAAALVFGVWYPWPYRALSGGAELFTILVAVDVVLGPLLTLAVFDIRKRSAELRRDVAVVVLLQLAALGYGLWTVQAARPVALVLEGDRFRVVAAIEVVTEELPQAPPELRRLPFDGPMVLGTALPEGGQRKLDAVMLALAGIDVGMRPSFWRPWDATTRAAALAASRPLAELRQRRPAAQAVIDAAANDAGRPPDRLRYLPLLARHGEWVVLLDADNGDVSGFAPVDGF